MKRITNIGGLALAIFLIGCATFETGAFRTINSITVGVEYARQGWVDHVNTQRVMLSNTPLEAMKLENQVAQVGTYYTKYQTLMRAAKVAVITYKAAPTNQLPVEVALTAVSAASADLINLIELFKKQ